MKAADNFIAEMLMAHKARLGYYRNAKSGESQNHPFTHYKDSGRDQLPMGMPINNALWAYFMEPETEAECRERLEQAVAVYQVAGLDAVAQLAGGEG